MPFQKLIKPLRDPLLKADRRISSGKRKCSGLVVDPEIESLQGFQLVESFAFPRAEVHFSKIAYHLIVTVAEKNLKSLVCPQHAGSIAGGTFRRRIDSLISEFVELKNSLIYKRQISFAVVPSVDDALGDAVSYEMYARFFHESLLFILFFGPGRRKPCILRLPLLPDTSLPGRTLRARLCERAPWGLFPEKYRRQ